MASITLALDAENGGLDFIADLWVMCHLQSSYLKFGSPVEPVKRKYSFYYGLNGTISKPI